MHGQSAPVQGQAGPSWRDGAEMLILTPTVVRFSGGVETEREKKSLVTMAALYFCIIGQGGDYRCGRFTLTQSSWTELGRCVSIGTISTHDFWGLSGTNKPPQVLFRLLSIPAGAREWVSRHRSKSCDRRGVRFQLGAISGSLGK